MQPSIVVMLTFAFVVMLSVAERFAK